VPEERLTRGETSATVGAVTDSNDEDGSYWSYGYNDRGELSSGKKYWVDNSPVAGMQLEYAFDNLGARNSSKTGGNGHAGVLREATYSPNALNQYT